jgi:hypothetical protein
MITRANGHTVCVRFFDPRSLLTGRFRVGPELPVCTDPSLEDPDFRR